MTQEKLKKLELIIAVFLLFIGLLILFPNPSITGYLSTELYSQNLNINIDQSQSYAITSKSSFTISSFRLSGRVIGPGIVEIYLEDEKGQRVLVYRNIGKKEYGLQAITGKAAAQHTAEKSAELIINFEKALNEYPHYKLSSAEKAVQSSFYMACEESCFIEMPMSKDFKYNLIFLIEKGTALNIQRILYTIKEEK